MSGFLNLPDSTCVTNNYNKNFIYEKKPIQNSVVSSGNTDRLRLPLVMTMMI